MPRSTPHAARRSVALTIVGSDPSTEPAEAPLAAQVATGLSKLALVLRSNAWRAVGPRGLTPTQAQILAVLRASGRPMRPSELAAALGVTRPTAGDAVATLVGKALVAKSPHPDDARAVAITLTAKGRREAERAAQWPDFLLAATDSLTPVEQGVFMKALVKMIRTLQERGEVPVSRMCVSCRFFRPNAHPHDPEQPHHCAFVDAPFGDRALRLECPEHEPTDRPTEEHNWRELLAAATGTGDPRATPEL